MRWLEEVVEWIFLQSCWILAPLNLGTIARFEWLRTAVETGRSRSCQTEQR